MSAFVLSIQAIHVTATEDYVNPPSFFPIIYISGSEFEMGYQYGYQAGKYISLVKDGLWSTLLERYDKDTILSKLAMYESYIADELPEVNYREILRGIAVGAQDAGYNVTYWDILLINFQVEFEWLPLPRSCTNMAAWGNATANGKLVVGSNFDFPWGRGYAYTVMVIAYPKNGNAFISFGVAGRLGNNFQMNDKGLVHESNKGPNARPEDIGYGLTDFIIGPYIAMTCSTAEEARDTLLRLTPSNGINHLVADVNGHAYAVEATHALKAIREPGAFGESNYIITANHYLNTTMIPAQKPWDPAQYYPSSWYRYITVEKYIEEYYGQITADTVMRIMSSTDYWNGSAWIRDAGWTGNTVNRFGSTSATLESKVAVPEDKVLWVCAGNPGYPQWGRLAPGSYGQYVKIGFKESPLSTTKALRSSAESELFMTAQAIDKLTANNDWSKVMVNQLFDEAKSKYWEATHKLALAELTNDISEALKLYGEASTGFAEVQDLCKYIARTRVDAEIIARLDALNATIISIRDGVATVRTELGELKADLAALGVNVTRLIVNSENRVTVQMQTLLGPVNATLEELGGKITAINGNVANVLIPGLGEVKVSVVEAKSSSEGAAQGVSVTNMLMYVVVVLSLLAAIVSAVNLLYLRRRKTS